MNYTSKIRELLKKKKNDSFQSPQLIATQSLNAKLLEALNQMIEC